MTELVQDIPRPTRYVVLISGNGSNLQAVIDSCQSGILTAAVAAVFSNVPDAYGLERARQANIPAISFPKPRGLDRSVYDAQLAERVAAFQPDWVLLLGWLRLLSQKFLDHFPGRVINLHPSLPGIFPGLHAIERAYQAYHQGLLKETGIMIHLVPDEGVDSGPVLAQRIVPIFTDDELDTLERRVHDAEHELIIDVLKTLSPGSNPSGGKNNKIIRTREDNHAQSNSICL